MNGLRPSGFKDNSDLIPSWTGDVYPYQLLFTKRLAQEEEYPIPTPVEYESLTLLDSNQPLNEDIEHLIRTHTSILDTSPTSALRRTARSRHHDRCLGRFSIVHLPVLPYGHCVVRTRYPKSARRHD